MVVVAIITVLIGLLIPALAKARGVAQRTKCLSNQRGIITACITYGSENDGYFPSAQTLDGTVWAYSFDIMSSTAAPTPKVPMGLGLLLANKTIAPGDSGKLLHCPSLDTSNSPTPNHCMDTINTWGAGASWYGKPGYENTRIINGYQYRSRTLYLAANRKLIRRGKGSASMVVHSDTIDFRFGVNYHHRNGYNTVSLDGHGAFYSDPNLTIDAISVGGGASETSTNLAYEKMGTGQ